MQKRVNGNFFQKILFFIVVFTGKLRVMG